MDSSSRDRILTEALSWIGTPWHHQGRIKGVGVDCAMFLCEVYERAGLVPHIDPRPYSQDWHFHRSEEKFLSWVTDYGEEINTPEPGCVAIFKFGRCFSHGAIVTNWPMVIHSYTYVGVREQDSTQGKLADREVKFYRVKS